MNLSEINLSDIDIREAGDWPLAGKTVLIVLVIAAVLGAGYYFLTEERILELEKVTLEEKGLRTEFSEKMRATANLEALREQLRQMEADLEVMLKQLPTGTEMPDLLEDISNTGKKNGLEFDLFKPEAEQPRDFYAAKPITIKARGTYHQFGAFVSGVAALSRIVTLENATLSGLSSKDDKGVKNIKITNEPLTIDAKLQTYRYGAEANAPSTPPQGAANKPSTPPQGATKK